MWTLDPTNSPSLIERLRPHARRFELQVLWAGEGWRSLVEECHDQIVGHFPDYELLNVKQKYGVLAFQAFPRSDGNWSEDEWETLQDITGRFGTRSEDVCEWCGAPGTLRTERDYLLTLCDRCDAAFPDPPARPPKR